MHFNRLNFLGIVFFILMLLIIFIDPLNTLFQKLTYPFLMGSSIGKSIIFFFLMGSMLILGQAIKNSKFKDRLKPGNYYLKLVIITVILIYIIGILLEIWIRTKFGVSIFTTFVSTSSSISTSSIIHSHVFKSMLGVLISDVGLYMPSGIHTGVSIAQYVPRFALIIFAAFPAVYVLGLLSIDDRRDLHAVILIFAIATSLIGILDGGLFSAPALTGLAGLLGIYSIKKPFSPRDLISPTLVIVILVILRITLGLIGSHPDVYMISEIGNHNNVEMNGFEVLNEKMVDGKTELTISSKLNEISFINQTYNLLKDKSPVYFVSWNIYSYF